MADEVHVTGLELTLSDAFALTGEERELLARAPFSGPDEAGWFAFAVVARNQIVAAYVEGEISLEQALQHVRSCSVGCRVVDRASLMALTADLALRNPPATRKGRRPQPATWLVKSVASLVEMLHEDRPTEPIAPNEMNGWTTPILETALSYFVTLGLCDSVDIRTFYSWYLKGKRATQFNSTSAA